MIEQLIADLIASNKELAAAQKENTAALREILSAGSVSVPSTAEAPAPKPAKKQARTKPEPEAPAAEPEPEAPAAEVEVAEETTPTKVSGDTRPAADEFSDPLDPNGTTVVVKGDPEPGISPEKVIEEITTLWKQKMTAADADGKAMLKDKFPELRAKWGLKPDDKLAALSNKPENLVGLLSDIKAL